MFIGTHKTMRYVSYRLVAQCFYLFFRHVSSLVLGYLQEARDFFSICAAYTKSTSYLSVTEN